MTLYLRRRASFSAGFQTPPPGEAGRGHDYQVELTVGGEIAPETGMVVNIKDVDAVLKGRVVGPLDGRLLDREVSAFRDTPPTPERLTEFIWEQCRDALPPLCRVARVTLWPNGTLRAERSLLDARGREHRGGPRGGPMQTVTRTYDFSASHRLHSAALSDEENAEVFGKCNRINGHGHNYEVEVTLAGTPDPRSGLLWDLDRLDAAVDEVVLKPYDHRHLNRDVPAFRELNPTSENLTRVVWDSLAARLAHEELGGARLHRVAVRETARNYFEYYGEEE